MRGLAWIFVVEAGHVSRSTQDVMDVSPTNAGSHNVSSVLRSVTTGGSNMSSSPIFAGEGPDAATNAGKDNVSFTAATDTPLTAPRLGASDVSDGALRMRAHGHGRGAGRESAQEGGALLADAGREEDTAGAPRFVNISFEFDEALVGKLDTMGADPPDRRAVRAMPESYNDLIQ
mmetsp:Transcript_100655/g.230978  ORF Transcript_100655/g.230978 Transcript_100655/m.230978 type:complete len:175 (+) Transcript_100655:55-579(+)|eukprot:CAMPEP_0204366056 /NCGR_PEP_ID=MMETSP0469-20131031/42373_1 /ASSEMBLY_ACC=CAM_ASM_000384 /TAXON_ID=2969 /ORGANISM="Oxyrrhis marina" /LENGTH=174 /DNA_ID=CAMNT_0051355205 /DNA_START=24 /DNA_END=548 /DNA_ORIENTATION=+